MNKVQIKMEKHCFEIGNRILELRKDIETNIKEVCFEIKKVNKRIGEIETNCLIKNEILWHKRAV